MDLRIVEDLLVVSFDYRPGIVDDIKKINYKYRRFNQDTKEWEIDLHYSITSEFVYFLNKYRDRFKHIPEELSDFLIDGMGDEIFEREIGIDDIAPIQIDGLLRPLYDFQKVGASYMIRRKRTFNSDDMGLGKTIQTISAIHHIKSYPALIVCPASVKYNWRDEILKTVADTSISILPDDKINSQFVIINYDQIKKFSEEIKKVVWKCIVFDESHMLKSSKTQRFKEIRGIIRSCNIEYIYLLTGTPILNKPQELLPQLELMDRLNDFGGHYGFTRKFCGMVDKGFGNDTSGASNLDKLHKKLKEVCMVRRLKEEVLPDLPEKIVSIIKCDLKSRVEYDKARDNFLKYLTSSYGKETAMKATAAEHLVKISYLKKICAIQKISAATEWIDNFLEGDRKLVVFASSKEVIEALVDRYKCDKIDGGVEMEKRQGAVKIFQSDDNVKIIILSIKAANAGITLTSASTMLFLEQEWTPAIHDQAEARCHRISQKNCVDIYYLLAKDSIDEDIFFLLGKKRNVVDAVNSGKKFINDQSILSDLISRMLG